MIAHRRGCRALLALAALALAGPGGACHAQFEEEDEPPPAGAAVVAARPMFLLQEMQFNSWLFRQSNAPTRDQFEAALTLRIEEVNRACRLTDAQRSKLRLAGRGDVARFFAQVDARRRELQDRQYEQDQISVVFQKIQPLQAAYNAGLFEDGSLFARTLAAQLDEEQARAYAASAGQRRQFRYRAKVDLAVATWSKSLGLTSGQARDLAALIMAGTRPPRNFGQQETYVVLLQASRIDEAKFRLILDDRQWPIFQRLLAQAKQLEPALVRAGYVPEDDDPPDADEPRGREEKR